MNNNERIDFYLNVCCTKKSFLEMSYIHCLAYTLKKQCILKNSFKNLKNMYVSLIKVKEGFKCI